MTEAKQAYTPRELGGNLFKNTYKEEGSNQPDYRGDCCINGVVYKISAWIKEKSDGSKYMSLSYEVKDAGPTKQSAHQQQKANAYQPQDDNAPPF